MGYSSRPENILLCVGALGSVLNEQGLAVDTGAALNRVQQALAS